MSRHAAAAFAFRSPRDFPDAHACPTAPIVNFFAVDANCGSVACDTTGNAAVALETGTPPSTEPAKATTATGPAQRRRPNFRRCGMLSAFIDRKPMVRRSFIFPLSAIEVVGTDQCALQVHTAMNKPGRPEVQAAQGNRSQTRVARPEEGISRTGRRYSSSAPSQLGSLPKSHSLPAEVGPVVAVVFAGLLRSLFIRPNLRLPGVLTPVG